MRLVSKRLLSRIKALVPIWAAELGVVEGLEELSVGVPELLVPLAPEPAPEPGPEPEPELEASAAVSAGRRLRSALRTLICTSMNQWPVWQGCKLIEGNDMKQWIRSCGRRRGRGNIIPAVLCLSGRWDARSRQDRTSVRCHLPCSSRPRPQR